MLKTLENLKIKKIPADTNVAEWINADAGTGASIESGSQICAPICADFILALKKKKNANISKKLNLKNKIKI